MRHRYTAPLALFVLALSACAGSNSGGTTTPRNEPAPPPVPLVQLVDPTTPGVARADITALSQSQHYQTFVDLLSLALEIWDSSATGITNAILRSSEIVIFLGRSPSGEIQPVLLLRGNFVEGDARRIFPADEDVAEETRSGIRLYRVDQGLVAGVGGHTIILGRIDAVTATVQRQIENGSGHLPNDSAFGTLIETLGLSTANAGFAVALDETTKTALAEELGVSEGVLAAFSGLGLQLTLGQGLEVRGTLMSDSSIQAAAMLMIANQIIARIRHDQEVAALGIEGLLGAIQLRRDGGNILLMLSAGDQTLRQAASSMGTALRAQRDAATTAAPAP